MRTPRKVDDLTTEVLQKWKAHIEGTIQGADTRAAYYSRVRGVIRFGLKVGLNAAQINATLTRMQVLWTPAPRGQVDPTPISREDFYKLLGWQAETNGGHGCSAG